MKLMPISRNYVLKAIYFYTKTNCNVILALDIIVTLNVILVKTNW